MNIFKKIVNRCDDYADFQKNLEQIIEPKIKGDMFEYLTKFVFKYHHLYASHTKEIYMYADVPLKIMKKCKLPSRDKGIDLVWLNTDEKIYSIQSKFRTDRDKIVPMKKLSTFAALSKVFAKNIYKGILVTNTYGICKEIVNSKHFLVLDGEFFDGLYSELFNILKGSFRDEIVVLKPCEPRDYQIDVINSVVKSLSTKDRGILNMACGTGKTLVSYFIWERLKVKKTIIAVPSLYLLSQIYSDYMREIQIKGIKINTILIGSDADVDIKDNKGLLLTTNKGEIDEWITKRDMFIIFTTYQSATMIKKIDYDLCIFDEAHKTVGDKHKKFSHLLRDGNIKIKKRLFMTATLKIFNKKNDKVISMDDKSIYGDIIGKYTIADGIDQGYLTDYRIMTPYITNQGINTFFENNINVNTKKSETNAHFLACAIILLKAIDKYYITHILTYHSTVNKAKDFVTLLNDLKGSQDIDIYTLNGKDKMIKRQKVIRAFEKSALSIICSARVLQEGVNIPIVDGVCFVDPKNSEVDIIQSCGRPLRRYPHKRFSYIILPFISQNIEDLTKNNAFKNICSIVRALHSVDGGLTYFDIQTGVKSRGGISCENIKIGRAHV